MPKQTFFNLASEKKQRIIAAGKEEFAEHPYLKTSINNIIKKAEISKGSFYQYFDNKKDLYKYIIDQASEKKIEFLKKKIYDYRNLLFFDLLRELFVASIQFKNIYPEYSKIGDRLLTGGNEALKKEIYTESKPKSNDFFENIIDKSIEKGELDPKLDIKFTAYMLTDFSISIVNYFFANHNPEDLEEIMDYVDKMLYIMKNGIYRGENNGLS